MTVSIQSNTDLQSVFLRVCLSRPSDIQKADIETVLDLAALKTEPSPASDLIALFCAQCEACGIFSQNPVLRTWLALSLREAKRSEIVERQSLEVLDLAQSLGLEIKMLRGPELARRCYDNPESRHSHAVRVLLKSKKAAQTLHSALQKQGWTREEPSSTGNCHTMTLTGTGRVTIVLYERLFAWTNAPHDPFDLPFDHLRALDIMGSRQTEPYSNRFRWACDLVFLLRRSDLDINRFARDIIRAGFTESARRDILCILDWISPLEPVRPTLNALSAQLGSRRDGRELRRMRANFSGSKGGIRGGIVRVARRFASRFL